MGTEKWELSFLALHPQIFLKRLEVPFLYHVGRDELYEIDDLALHFLSQCDGSRLGRQLTTDREFVSFCLEEGLLETEDTPHRRDVPVAEAPIPSLRYLELQLLHQCNLRCRHCYLGPPRSDRLALSDALTITREFSEKGGLRLLISGGEPLLYPDLQEFLAETTNWGIRRILLTNGTLISSKILSNLKVEEIQISLDGWRKGHEQLRGPGTFDHVLRGIRAVQEAGLPLSIATMIHKGNLSEFEELAGFVEKSGAIEWGVDLPCEAGTWNANRELMVSPEEAAPYLNFAFGGGYHGAAEGYSCGRHLMTVLPSGLAVKCGFYEKEPLGDARQGLIKSWLRLKHIPLDQLECRDCPVLEECTGGCRFRAGDLLSKDPLMCRLFGQSKVRGGRE
jgi:radical SAM protein with 4Fe4S-binding SPASM domain